METLEYRTVDKSDWGDGPWQHEPDKKQWLDEETQLPCLIHRNSELGALCGYVGVYEGHPYFELRYEDVPVDVHGGLTFGDFCMDGADEAKGLCHKSDDPRKVYWLGFDCAHLYDMMPGMAAHYAALGIDAFETDAKGYKDIAWVENEVRKLAKQVKEAA